MRHIAPLSYIIALPFEAEFARAEDNDGLLKKFYRRKDDLIIVYTRDYAHDRFWHRHTKSLYNFIEEFGLDSEWYLI